MKERIVNEINRLAEFNGRRAPGQKRFEKETGIGTSVWRGKLWAKWSDAVAQAGFAPKSLNASLNSDKVLDDFAAACRHYGQPPSYAELRHYGQARPNFVGVNTNQAPVTAG